MSRLERVNAFEGISDPGTGPCECARLVEEYDALPIEHRPFPNKASRLMALRTLTWCMGYKALDGVDWFVVLQNAEERLVANRRNVWTMRIKNIASEKDAKLYACAYAQDHLDILPVIVECVAVMDDDDYQSKLNLWKQGDGDSRS